ncbi:MAG: hypothetical protein NZ992_00685 [Candidatus Korarchaeum sp.]|nr:hypothetical protein [Candidatus Korarchaeum sp.]MDW8035512.1 hypothetical protein [Candidatus Korarchaeum sp.]
MTSVNLALIIMKLLVSLGLLITIGLLLLGLVSDDVVTSMIAIAISILSLNEGKRELAMYRMSKRVEVEP